MDSMSSKSASPPKRATTTMARSDSKGQSTDGNDLALSLNQLSLSASSPAKSPRSPRPLAPGTARQPIRSPSTPRPGSSMRNSSTPSRSGTPTLLRKASLQSLHAANSVAPPRRSSSANLYPPRSPLRDTSPEMPPPPPAPTAESVASEHFKAELAFHHADTTATHAETVVILHDSCYGHRYSRPRTSRAALSTIVERPERLKACALGVSAAYVRLGDRHDDGAFPIRPGINPASIPMVPFRIQKTTRRLSLTAQTVANVHGTKWMEELKLMCESAEAKLAMNGKELQRPEMDRVTSGETPPKLHEGDLYLCAESLDALEGSLGGVCDAVDAVFRPQGPKRAFVAIRPPGHHCSADYPSGFCWINNVHVGIMHAILSHGLTHAAIIDFDLHHGDGSQAIAWQHNSRGVNLPKNAAWWKKTSIGYFSLHDINSYPCEMGDAEKVRNASICIDNAHGQNIWNVHLEPWKTEADFFKLYESKYAVLLEKTRSYLRAQTDRLRAAGSNSKAAIFLSAGFDASEWEGAGMQRHNVNVPTEFYARLTRDVVRIAAEEGTSVEGRIISVLEGGYSDRALCSGILSHLCGLAGDDPATKEEDFNGLGREMGQKIGSVRGRKDSSASERGARRYEPSWWSATELDLLEQTVTATKPPPEPRVPRNTTQPTYSSPTQSFSAKIVVPKLRRSTSGLLGTSRVGTTSRAPTPPPPDVSWQVAAHELGKLLIPSGRQTDSCKHEDLNAEATRARREKVGLAQTAASSAGVVSQEDRAPPRMSLRERKAKPTLQIDEESDEDRKHRRRTVAGPAVLASERAGSRGGTPAPKRQSGRRLSAASTIVSENLDPVPAGPLTAPISGVSRPGTSLTIRPESSMSARGATGPPLPVKKTRAPAKKEPAPRAPRGPKKAAGPNTTSTTARKTSPLSATPASVSPVPTASVSASDTGIDELTNNMKKVKITLVTKAQREARERERLAREKLAHADSISVASTPVEENKSAVQSDQLSALPSPPADVSRTIQSSPHVLKVPELPLDESSPESPSTAEQFTVEVLPSPSTPGFGRAPVLPQKVPLPPSSPVSATPSRSPTRSPTKDGLLSQGADVFISYQPEGPPASPIAQQQPQPLQWLPPNTSTPSVMRRADLPVFTATSAIPFAVPPRTGKSPSSPLKQRDDLIWEVPETPQK